MGDVRYHPPEHKANCPNLRDMYTEDGERILLEFDGYRDEPEDYDEDYEYGFGDDE